MPVLASCLPFFSFRSGDSWLRTWLATAFGSSPRQNELLNCTFIRRPAGLQRPRRRRPLRGTSDKCCCTWSPKGSERSPKGSETPTKGSERSRKGIENDDKGCCTWRATCQSLFDGTRGRTAAPAATCPESGGSACCYWDGDGTQCNHPASGRTPPPPSAPNRSSSTPAPHSGIPAARGDMRVWMVV